MDVPFKSISVRDLLPSHDLDNSSPLSAPDLRLIIDHLQVRSVQIKSKVQNYIVSHHSDFSVLFSQCSAAFSGAEHLSGEVSDLIRLISESPIDAEIKEVVDEVSEKRREVREKRKVLELVSVIVQVSEKLKFVREMMRGGRVVEAAEGIRELEEALRIREGEVKEEDGEPVVYGLLRSEWMDCFQEIQEVLAKFMENAVSFDQQSNALRVKYWSSINGNNSVELHTVLTAMDVVGVMDFGLAKVADLIIKYVISRAVNPESHISFSEEMNQDSGCTTEVVLKMVPSFEPELKGIDGQAIFTGSIQVVKFIYDTFCFQNSHWMRCFGRLTWPRMSELIISNFLSKVVPDDPSKLADFQSIIQLTTQFETDLKDLKFISPSDNKDKRLSEFADNVEVHFASRKKVEILAKARSLLLQSNFVLPNGFTRDAKVLKNEQTNENSVCYADLLFSSERCVVSGGAAKLMALVHQTLKDVCLSSTRVGIEFYHAARDALLLYEAVIPAKLGRQLDSINQAAVLIYNDCLYLSREIHGLAFEYRPDLPSSLKELVVFVDLAPRFQLMAEDILHRQIQLVIRNLKEATDGADGFQNTHQNKEFESAKFSIDQVVFILEKVHIIWEPLLLPLTYKRCMSMVLEAVFSRITKDILLLDDMAAEETLQLQNLIRMLLESLSSLLESLNSITDARKLPEGAVQSIDELVPSLRKIRKLAELLDMPLRSITSAWECGELFCCGFVSSEVVDFIKAIFTDSPLRKDCLWRIESADFM
ncbi:centromere/kinetochore protein zw10-like [Heracleum sosnowskyi]|uniref:Centromere/kinetochore protein zw10-like n=1 Tax=Heracleum sosnowskyi TaxID=360622 RepID=A0AAD8JJK2_9APIA|nr:centromere/kinetochore protein zw10-like [Heracleum sosnowskyi]